MSNGTNLRYQAAGVSGRALPKYLGSSAVAGHSIGELAQSSTRSGLADLLQQKMKSWVGHTGIGRTVQG